MVATHDGGTYVAGCRTCEDIVQRKLALFREGLRTAPTLEPSAASTVQRSQIDYTIAEWADRCRFLLALIDADEYKAIADAYSDVRREWETSPDPGHPTESLIAGGYTAEFIRQVDTRARQYLGAKASEDAP